MWRNGVENLEDVEFGDHVCVFYDDPATAVEAMARFARAGIARGARVICQSALAAADPGAFASEWAGTDASLQTGQVVIVGPTVGVTITAAQRLGYCRGEIHSAVDAGFSGLYAMGDLTEVIGEETEDASYLPLYETELNRVLAASPAAGLCLYHRPSMSRSFVAGIDSAHPTTINPEGPGTVLRARYRSSPSSLCLTGEADLSNRGALVALVEHAYEDLGRPDRFTFDITGMGFADVGALQLFLTTATMSPAHVDIQGATGVIARSLDLLSSDPTTAQNRSP